MSLLKKIALNTIVHTVGKFGASFIGIFIVAILTRYLGVEGYGAYTTIFAYLFFFSILSDLGLYVISINELGRNPFGEQKFFNNIFSLRFISAAVFLMIACSLVWLLPYSPDIQLGVIIASVSIFLSLLDQILVSYFQNKINLKTVAIAEISGKLVLLGLTLTAVFFKASLMVILIAVVAGFLVNFLVNLGFIRKYIKIRFEFDIKVWRYIITKSWPVGLTALFSLIYFKADTLFLSLMPANPIYAASAEEAVGLYGAPYKILEVLIAFPAIFMGLISPLLSRAWSQAGSIGDKENNEAKNKFNFIFQNAFDTLTIIIWPLIAGVVVLARPLIVLVAGSDFIASVAIFRILILATAIIFLSHLTTYTIIALGKQKKMIKYYLAAAIMAVAGYIIFIPRYSYFAAAVVTVLVELFMLLATFFLLKKYSSIKLNIKTFIKAMLSAIFMGLALYYLSGFNVILLIAIGAIIYFLALVLLKGIKVDFFKQFLKNNNKESLDRG